MLGTPGFHHSHLNSVDPEAVTEAVGKLRDEYTVEECANYLLNCSYGST